MSKLDRLIEELCLDGVKYTEIGNSCIIKTGSGINKSYISQNPGKYPVINSGQAPLGYINKYNVEDDEIGIASRGAGVGYVSWTEGRYFRGNLNYSVTIKDKKILNNRFLYHYLQDNKHRIDGLATFQGIPALNASNFAKLLIPLPPLPVQEEIVRILDNFTELTAELTAELTSRRKQYEYYRDELLTFGDEVEWKTLEEVGEIGTGATPSTKNSKYWTNGTIPWMSSGEVNKKIIHSTEKFITPLGYEKSSTKIIPKNAVVIALAGQGKTRGQVAITEIELCTNQSLAFIIPYNTINSYYLYYYMLGEYHKLRHISSGDGTRGGLNLKMIRNYKIPIPPLSEQERIVSILDKFDALVNDISIGLPAEIEARQKQYEYYREKLLTFKELETKET